ncbi:PorT family protein [Pontibacter qinzhouensis]|uniref:PorT family protein n=1 Tax=Pontibacter qinzhouensis TaxID=2603253 RepID=A0A5C8JEA0_9BACT|nr:porin family protein [Pontibacter qinzhouensis]TXK36670.1 PorT family protein [Pontibacter qinzhouensis]
MKKTILSLVFLLATIVAAQAQGPRIGVRAGANLAGFEGNDNDAFKRRWGFHAGLTTSFGIIEDFLTIQPEVLYTQKGAQTDNEMYKLRTSFIEVPVLGRINAGPLYFELGPQVAVRIGEKAEWSNQSGSFVITDDDVNNLRRTNFGYAAGVGLTATPLGMSLGVRYTSDFGSAIDRGGNNPNLRNSVFMLTAGFALPTR